MPTHPSRASHFPAIEKRYGEPMKYWFEQMKKVSGKKYPEQIAFLRENFGFSQAHANALVMYSRGSKSSQRYSTYQEFLDELDPVKKKTVKAILTSIKRKYPKLELVMAWNKPMLKYGDRYIFGVAVASKHLLIAPFDPKVLKAVSTRLSAYEVNKKTVRVPVNWKVDSSLLHAMIGASIATTDSQSQSKKKTGSKAKSSKRNRSAPTKRKLRAK